MDSEILKAKQTALLAKLDALKANNAASIQARKVRLLQIEDEFANGVALENIADAYNLTKDIKELENENAFYVQLRHMLEVMMANNRPPQETKQ